MGVSAACNATRPLVTSSALSAQQYVFSSAYPTTYKFVAPAAPPPVTPTSLAPDTARRARNAVAYLLDHRYDPQLTTLPHQQQLPKPTFPPPIVPLAPPGSKRVLEQPGNVKISISPNPKTPKVLRDPTGVEKPRDNGYRNYTFAQRVQALTLMTHQYGAPYIEFVTGVKPKGQMRIMKVAQSRGFDFIRNPRIDDAYVVDGIRTGRPKGRKTLDKLGKRKRDQGQGSGRGRGSSEAAEDEEGKGEGEEEQLDGEDAEAEAGDGADDEIYIVQQADYAGVGTSEEHVNGITVHLASIQEYLEMGHNRGNL